MNEERFFFEYFLLFVVEYNFLTQERKKNNTCSSCRMALFCFCLFYN